MYSAHGHVNFGMPYPIIYKRDNKTFLACDTSVGSRPFDEGFRMNFLDLHTNKSGLKTYDKATIFIEYEYEPLIVDTNKTIADQFAKIFEPLRKTNDGGRKTKSLRVNKTKSKKYHKIRYKSRRSRTRTQKRTFESDKTKRRRKRGGQ